MQPEVIISGPDAKKREARLQAIGIPLRYADCRLESYQVENDGQRQALQTAREYIKRFDEFYDVGTSMLFSGRPGCGKTHLAVAIAREVVEADYSARYVTAADLIRAVWDARERRYTDQKNEDQVLNSFAGVGLLALDEVGAQPATEARQATLFEVISRRYDATLPTLVASNLAIDGIGQHLGERALSRLRQDGGRIVTFDWSDYRGRTC